MMATYKEPSIFAAVLKRFIAISFLTLVLATNTEFGQLFKLPVLIHHYLEHLEVDGQKSFADFLAEHYASEINHPDDAHSDHENLPFKSVDFHIVQVLIVVSHPEFKLSENSLASSSPKRIAGNQYLHSTGVGDSIWQPPCFG